MKPFKLIFLMLIALIQPSSVNSSDLEPSPLLSRSDLKFEAYQKKAGRSALASALNDPNPWSSFNQWICFPALRVGDVEIEYEGIQRKTPTLSGEIYGQRIEFDVSAEIHWNSEAVIHDWYKIRVGSEETCVYAAYLQHIDDHTTLWIIDRIKTAHGYWTAIK